MTRVILTVFILALGITPLELIRLKSMSDDSNPENRDSFFIGLTSDPLLLFTELVQFPLLSLSPDTNEHPFIPVIRVKGEK